MAKEIQLFEGQSLPAHMKNAEVSSVTKSLMGGGGSTKRVSIRGSVFRMMVGSQEIARNDNRSINMIIVGAAPTYARTYYESTFDADNVTAPSCWSDDGQSPSPHVAAPQAKTCASCPQNIKGSGQGNSRACRTSARIAVAMEGDVKGDVFAMSIPATSLFGDVESPAHYSLQDYVRKLAAHNFDITKVVTEFKFDTEASTPKLMFRAVRPVSDEEWEVVSELTTDPEVLQHIEDRVFDRGGDRATRSTPNDGVDDKPLFADAEDEDEAPVEKPKKAPKNPDPVPEDDVEEAEPEPKKRPSKAKPADVDDADLDDLIAEWADD